MPRLSIVIDDLAERFSFEKTKLNSLARVLREAGLITSGARGVNAPEATTMDAARLLITMMLDSRMPTVLEDLAIVGGFVPLKSVSLPKNFNPANLEEGLSGLLTFAGTAPEHVLEIHQFDFELIPYAAIGVIEISTHEDDEEYSVKDQRSISFTHPDVVAMDLHTRDAPYELPDSYYAVSRRFPVGFMQKPRVDRHHLIALGKLIAGGDQ